MGRQRTDKGTLDSLVHSLEQYESEQALESLRTGNPFAAGMVEGISNAIDKLGSARSGSQLQSVMQDLMNNSQVTDDDDTDDAYANGIAAGFSRAAAVMQDGLGNLSDTTDDEFF